MEFHQTGKVVIYYTHIDTLSYDLLMAKAYTHWPPFIQQSIHRYLHRQDQLLTAAGKLLLLQALYDHQLSARLLLKDLIYSGFQKPGFDYPVDFNISHAGRYVVLSFTTTGNTGVDIEEIKPVNRQEFRDVFTLKEWESLEQSPQAELLFYQLWTKKEAVVKAIGKGLYLPLTDIDVSGNTVTTAEQTYSFGSLAIDPGYAAHVAVTHSPGEWPTPQQIHLNQLIQQLYP